MRELVVSGSTGLLFAYAGIRDERLDPAAWERQLRVLSEQGFTAVDLSELWLPMADLSADDVQKLAAAVAATGMDIAGVSIIGVELGNPALQAEAEAKVRRGIKVTQQLRAPYLSIGFHALPKFGEAMPPQWVASDDEEFDRIGKSLAVLAQEASEVGIELTLEMFERGVLDRAANVLAIIEAAGSANVGANPDLANLLRPPWPIVEDWSQTFTPLVPHLNYWHVKNGMRMSLPDDSAVYQATDMGSGNIDYRTAILQAVRGGFRGPLAIEHYGGDAIAQAARGRVYLERVIAEVCAFENIQIKELGRK